MIYQIKMKGFITDKVTYVEGDGIRTYYKNGIYFKHKIIKLNEHTRKVKQNPA